MLRSTTLVAEHTPMSPNPRTIQLWRRCLRSCKVMDPAMANYYRRFAYEHIMSHWQEDRPEKIIFLQRKGEENLAWILRKYCLHEPIREVDPPSSVGDGSTADCITSAPVTDAPPGQSGIALQEAREEVKDEMVWRPGG